MILRRITDWPTLSTGSPFDEFERMRRNMDRLYGALRGGLAAEPGAGVFPLMNVTEDNDHFYIRAELPGVKANELDITVTGDSLTIAGERKIPAEAEQVQYHRREREAGKFSRVITLPSQIDTNKVEAFSKDGILTISLAKSEAAKPKQITIKVS
ncbi:MAG: Hsp20/alpha crystallin family protein [Deltaproteobacteria bacterium]|nr:Hsp20/alpha crystallin family protein [Deltaproteobacteria bacterium]